MKNYPSIALGTWSWGTGAAGGDQVFGNQLSVEELKPVFDAAIKTGLNLWDTALVYGMGASEKILGEFVEQSKRENLILSTKFTPQIVGAFGNNADEMFAISCGNLHTDYIDLYWIHNPADVEMWTPQLLPLLKSGKVKSVGVSNHNLSQIKRANEILGAEGFRISAVQNHYSLLYRSSEKAGILDYCKENDIAFFAYMVLEQGALSGKYDTTHPLPAGSQRGSTYNPLLPQIEALISTMKAISEKHKVGVPQIAVAWAIAKGTTPIIGVTKPQHVTDAVTAMQVKLSAEEVRELENIAEQSNVDTRGSWENPMA